MIERPELAARLALRTLPGLRDAAINRLLAEHGSAQRAIREHTQLIEVGAKSLPDERTRARVNDAMRTIDRDGITVITPDDALYPQRLAMRMDRATPPLLFLLGNAALLRDVGIAIVGSRAMSEYGRMVAEDFARQLAAAGVCIISGLARGIDAAAHQAALDAGGVTIAVLGNGVDIVYPPVNRRLRRDIVGRGLLISQYLPGEHPARHHFPERNLVLAALAEGVVVVEAGKQSGALITARHAGDLNVYAMAVPGAVGRAGSVGANQLLREGVVCVTSAAEVLETIDREGIADRLMFQRRRNENASSRGSDDDDRATDPAAADGLSAPTSDARAVQVVLASDALHVDDIAAAAALTVPATLAALLELELSGMARQHPGARFSRRILAMADAHRP